MPNALQQIWKQVRDFWTRLTGLQKTLLIIVATATLGGLLWLFLSAPQPQMAVLFTDLSATDAAKIIEKLEEKQIPYELEDDGKTILVPRNELYKLRLELAQEGLPESSTVGYEIFDKTNLGMSEFVQKLNYRRALEGELARTIASLDEVEKARVHLVIPERRLFEAQQEEPTASVVVKLKPNRSLRQRSVEAIQFLVASSVEGLSPDNVTVIDNRGRVLSETADQQGFGGLTASQYEIKEKVDNYLTRKVQSLLDQVLGVGNAVVQVNAELDFTQTEETVERYDPAGQVVRSEQTISEQSQSQDSLNYPAVNSQSARTNTITNYEISKEIRRIIGEVGRIKRLTVSALINGKPQTQTLDDGTQVVEYVPRSEEELQQLEQIIRNAVGFDPNRNDRISVVSVEFETMKEAPPAAAPMAPEEIAEKVLLILMMLLALFAVWRFLHSPVVKKRLEVLMLPTDIEKQRMELMKALAERQKALLETLSRELEVPALPGPEERPELLEMVEQIEQTPEELLRQEMHKQVQKFLTEQPEEAARLLRSMLRKGK